MRLLRRTHRLDRPTCLGAMLYLFIIATLIGCDSQSTRPGPDQARGALIVVIGPSETDPQWAGIAGGAQRYAGSVPFMRVQCVAPAADTPRDLLAKVQETLADRPQAVCLYVADCASARPAIDAVLASHALVVTMGTPCGDVRVAGHVGPNLPDGAEALGRNLVRIAGGRLTYVLVHANGVDEQGTRCYQRFSEQARQQDIRLLADATTPRRGESAAVLLRGLLERFPNAGLVVSLDPAPWLLPQAGLERELRAANAGFRFATLSAVPALWARLGTPERPGDAVALVGPLDGEIGYLAVEMAAQLLLGGNQTSRERTVPCELVTADNLADFARRYAAAANGLDVQCYLPPVDAK